MSTKKINIALAGLGFGAEFIPIYQAHPNANLVAVNQRDSKKLGAIQKAFGIAKGYTSYDEMLTDPAIDAESAIVSRQRHRRVRAVLRALPERDRQCLSMRAEGVTYRGIAAALGMSLGAVAKAVARAAVRVTNAVKE